MEKIGLFFGTFNPIHNGHIELASFFHKKAELDFIWFVITPHNPWKKATDLLDETERFKIVSRALVSYAKFKVNTIEFKLPKPNYTHTTLTKLKKQYPYKVFKLILGADNLISFDKWKNYDKILDGFELLIYPRKIDKSIPKKFLEHSKILWPKAPNLTISSSEIRKKIHEGADVSTQMPIKSWEYIKENNFYSA
tara:strand:+ start:16710 stop:17294 length:585 start_codon:yes stop_codon:yes gene_type:complete